MPRQTAAGVSRRPSVASSITVWRIFSTSSSPSVCRLAAAGAALADDAALGVGEEGDGLGPARIDPQDVHPTSLSASARERACRHGRLMWFPMFRVGSPRVPLLLCGVALLLLAATASFRAAAPEQTRALWVTRTTLTSPESIRADGRGGASRRFQHPARPGAWPRRRLLLQHHRAARDRACRQSRRSIRWPPCSTTRTPPA